MTKKKPSAETLRRLYWDEENSLNMIGQMFDVDGMTIRNWMISYDIPRRDLSKGKKRSKTHSRRISEGQKRLIAEGKRRYDGEHSPAWKGGPVTVNCGWCGAELQMPKARVKSQEHFFCRGTDCRSKWMSVTIPLRKYDKPHYGSKEITCDDCGKTFRRQNHAIHKRNYCSECCPPRGASGDTELTCDNCDKNFLRPNHRDKGQKYIFCSPSCKKEFMRGDKIYNYKGGYEPYYGPNWREQRRKARERDSYTCQHCGIHQSKLDRALDVHHIVPFCEFGLANYIQANDLQNLLSLCQSCHSTVTMSPHTSE